MRAVRVHQLRLRVRLGLDDPADTGRLWAFMGPLAAAAHRSSGVQIRLEPDFTEATLAFEASGRLSVVPLRMLALVLGFALSPSSLRAWRSLASRD